jgi:hypothetical protein
MVAVHVSPAPSLTVTLPVGVPAPRCDRNDTEAEGHRLSRLGRTGSVRDNVVLVFALFTVGGTPEALELKLPSPE